jgi:hypothetical protein
LILLIEDELITHDWFFFQLPHTLAYEKLLGIRSANEAVPITGKNINPLESIGKIIQYSKIQFN